MVLSAQSTTKDYFTLFPSYSFQMSFYHKFFLYIYIFFSLLEKEKYGETRLKKKKGEGEEEEEKEEGAYNHETEPLPKV